MRLRNSAGVSSMMARWSPSCTDSATAPDASRETVRPVEMRRSFVTATWASSPLVEAGTVMSTLDSILQLLEKWPKWKRVKETPDRVDQLEARLTALEVKLQRAPGQACPKCGAFAYRVESSKPHPTFGNMGALVRLMKCGDCGFQEETLLTPGT